MNINRELKIIWWAPERCATKLTAEILKKFNFEVYDKKTDTFSPLTSTYHSHEIVFPEEFRDFTIICNVRNPYDKILSYYLNFTSVGKNFVYFKNKKQELREKIDRFAKELFVYAINQKILGTYIRQVPVRTYVTKLSFDEVIPKHVIRMENLEEDFSKLNFITQSKWWQSGEFQDLIQNNKFMNKRPFGFNELYTFESAARVFDYYKKHFFICDYNPFSFTNQDLTNDEKIKFLHEIL